MKVFFLLCSFYVCCLCAEDLQISSDHLHTVSTFDEVTFFTTYDLEGNPLWEIPFNSLILSWELYQEHIYIFSKARNAIAYFLTCINPSTGEFLWERAILAPGTE